MLNLSRQQVNMKEGMSLYQQKMKTGTDQETEKLEIKVCL